MPATTSRLVLHLLLAVPGWPVASALSLEASQHPVRTSFKAALLEGRLGEINCTAGYATGSGLLAEISDSLERIFSPFRLANVFPRLEFAY